MVNGGVITDTAWTTFKTQALGLGVVTVACGLGITVAHRLKAEDNRPISDARPAAASETQANAVARQPESPAPLNPDDGDWVGQRVIIRFGTLLADGPQGVDDPKREARSKDREPQVLQVYRVEKASGPWLWLVHEKKAVRGWAPVAQVVVYDRAIEYFTDVIRADPKNGLAYRFRGTLWQWKEAYDNAIADFTAAIEIDPKNAQAYNDRGDAWWWKTDFDKAIADFTAAIAIAPKDAQAYDHRGLAWREKREYDKAIADFTEAMGIAPKDAEAYNHCAWIWATCPDARHRDGKRAVEAATQACALAEEKDAHQLEMLAAAYAEAGDFGAAVKWQENAMAMSRYERDRLIPEVATAYFTRGARTRLELYQAKKPYRQEPGAR